MDSIGLFEAMRTQPSMRGYTAEAVSEEDFSGV